MRDRSAVQSVAMLFGVVFLLVGILGFIPGITTDYGDMKFAKLAGRNRAAIPAICG